MTRLRSLVDVAVRVFFVSSLCLFALLYGVVAGHYEIFPHAQLRDAQNAAEALFRAIWQQPDGAADRSAVAGVRNHAGIDDGALILVSGGPGYLESFNPNGGCLAWLMDRQGEIRHIWKFSPELWADLERVRTVPGISEIYPVDVHLFEDGGLLVSFQGRDTWPFAVGLARIDKDSNTVWKKECHAHHWFTITPDGRIITPTLRVVESPLSVGLTRGRIESEEGKILEDMITVMSLDGEVLEEISMLEAIHGSGLIGLYHGAGTWADVDTNDPLHLNAVRRVGERIAPAHDWLNADDLLLSFRSINTIAILDRPTSRIKWLAAGVTLRQHSPRFLDGDHILVFDNYGGDESLGGTRLAQIDLNSRRAATIFPTREHPLGRPVYSPTGGHLELNRERNAVLMAVAEQSTVLEIDLSEGTVLWEYTFADKVDTQVFTAKYCYGVSFDMNQAQRTR